MHVHSRRRQRPPRFSIHSEIANMKVGRAGRLRAKSFGPFCGDVTETRWAKFTRLDCVFKHESFLRPVVAAAVLSSHRERFRQNGSAFGPVRITDSRVAGCTFMTSILFNTVIMTILRKTSQMSLKGLMSSFGWFSSGIPVVYFMPFLPMKRVIVQKRFTPSSENTYKWQWCLNENHFFFWRKEWKCRDCHPVLLPLRGSWSPGRNQGV